MKKAELLEKLKIIHKELDMSAKEYANYANEIYNHTDDDPDKVTVEMAYPHRTGAVGAQIEYIIKALEREEWTWTEEEDEEIFLVVCDKCGNAIRIKKGDKQE